ncbi:chemotaxis response regulator protein-glutamate methylesterase [Patescibacteria group bacterium AH-259-L07]|nr:chemotaxis response regulator protein-glutamate methylesterase [Patescibacteria group bacterium AH-259-L07]
MGKNNNTIKVLIVDDSFFMRKLLRELLNSDAEIEVVGEAKDGVMAIEEAARLKPDVITMDYNMPKMDGAEATEKILSGSEPLPVVIMLSAYVREEAEEAFKSLRAGAVDFVLKPSGELSLDIDKVKQEIITKIKVAARAHVRKHKVLKIKARKKKPRKETAAKAVIIGASTGGPPVVEDIIAGMPSNFSAAVLVVQHMPEHFTKTFAERLNKVSKIPVKEAEEGDIIKAGRVFIAPGGYHMKIEKMDTGKVFENVVHLTKELPKHGLRPAIDVLMFSAAHSYVNQTIGVVLTGMGDDGREGMRAIKTVHGHTIVQDPETAVVDFMPKAVIEEGLADEILPPSEIAEKIIELSKK